MIPCHVTLLLFLTLSLLLARPAARADPTHVPVIGLLMPASADVSAPMLHAFQRALDARGWQVGQNVALESRFADGVSERLPTLAAELVKRPVAIIVAGSPTAIRAATQATSSTSVVGIGVRTGLFAVFSRTSANLTGVGTGEQEAYSRAKALFEEVVPGVSRAALLWDASNPLTGQTWLSLASRMTGVRLQVVEVHGQRDVERAMAAARADRADALIVPASGLFAVDAPRIAGLALQHRLPTLGPIREFAEAGCLMSYGPNMGEMFARAALYVDRILHGAKPADLPVEPPPLFELAVNLKTAQALGLTVPNSLRSQAVLLIQ